MRRRRRRCGESLAASPASALDPLQRADTGRELRPGGDARGPDGKPVIIEGGMKRSNVVAFARRLGLTA
jgi:hypothetical protein